MTTEVSGAFELYTLLQRDVRLFCVNHFNFSDFEKILLRLRIAKVVSDRSGSGSWYELS